jgi:hypothetical protein
MCFLSSLEAGREEKRGGNHWLVVEAVHSEVMLAIWRIVFSGSLRVPGRSWPVRLTSNPGATPVRANDSTAADLSPLPRTRSPETDA